MEVKLFAQNFNPFGFLPTKIRFFRKQPTVCPVFCISTCDKTQKKRQFGGFFHRIVAY